MPSNILMHFLCSKSWIKHCKSAAAQTKAAPTCRASLNCGILSPTFNSDEHKNVFKNSAKTMNDSLPSLFKKESDRERLSPCGGSDSASLPYRKTLSPDFLYFFFRESTPPWTLLNRLNTFLQIISFPRRYSRNKGLRPVLNTGTVRIQTPYWLIQI